MMNILLPISSNNNINKGNSEEEFAPRVNNLPNIHKEDTIDLISKEKINEKENQGPNQAINDEREEEKTFLSENEEVTQESKDLYSYIKSTGRFININSISSLHDTCNDNFEADEECSSYFAGYQLIGQGGQGRVMRLRKENPPDLIAKIYDKSKEEEFKAEASILKDLRWSAGGGIGFQKSLVTPKHFGIVIDGGVGSLHEFGIFQRENNIQLEEEELLAMHKGIMRNYKAIRSISVLHRDIKPANIILHYNDLNLEIIDYGLADYDYSKPNWSGGVGTRGFSKHDLMENEKPFTKEELLKGDYYTIATTILFLADLKFIPRETKLEKEVNSSLKRVFRFKRLHEILKALLEGRDLIQDELESKAPDSPRGYDSGLSRYKDRFLDFILQKEEKEKKKKNDEAKIKEALHSVQSQITEKTVEDIERELKVAADNYLNHNEINKALNCYDLIVKTYITAVKSYQYQYRYPDAQPFFNEIRSIIDLKKPDLYDPLLFSTLGIYSYLVCDFEGARFFLRMGIEICKEALSMLILLSNYEHLCNEQGYSQDDHTTIEKIYDLLKTTRNDIFENKAFIKGWLENRKINSRNLVSISSEKEERKYEIMFIPYQKNEYFKDNEKLVFIAFISLCESRSTLLVPLLEENHRDLLLEIKHLCFCWNSEYFKWVSFEPNLETSLDILIIFVQLNKILQTYQGWDLSCREIKELKEASDLFEKKKDEIKRVFEEEEISGNFFKIFLENSLIVAFTGFVMKFSAPQPEKEITSAFVSDFLRIKLGMLLQRENSIEICFPKHSKSSSNLWDSFNVLKELFNSNFVSNPEMEDIEILKRMDVTLQKFQYRIKFDPSNKLNKYQMRLSHLEISFITNIWRHAKLPLIPESVELESLNFRLKDAKIFDSGKNILEKILVNKSLIKLSADFIRGVDNPRYFDDFWAKYLAKFIGSLKLLKSLKISIRDGLLTDEGVRFFEEALKELSDFESLELIFTTCPTVTDVSIKSLVETIQRSKKFANLFLKFDGCKQISVEIGSQLKTKMDSPLKEKANIQVKLS